MQNIQDLSNLLHGHHTFAILPDKILLFYIEVNI